MATQQVTGKKFDKALGTLYLVEHTIYDSENGLNLKHQDIIQTECENWVRRIGSALGEIRAVPKQRKPDEVILVTGCVEDGGTPLGERRDLSSRDPKSQLGENESPEDQVGDEDSGPRRFKRKGQK